MTSGSMEKTRETFQPEANSQVHLVFPVAGSSSCTSSCSLLRLALQPATAISFLPPAKESGKHASPYLFLSHSFSPLLTSYAVPDCERPTISVLPVMDSSTSSVLSNSAPLATDPFQPLAPVLRSICWSWLHLARSLPPLMYATTILSSDDFSGVTAQIFSGKEIGSQAASPSPTL